MSLSRRGAVKSTRKDAGTRRWRTSDPRMPRPASTAANERSVRSGQGVPASHGEASALRQVTPQPTSGTEKNHHDERPPSQEAHTSKRGARPRVQTTLDEEETESQLERLRAIPMRFLRFMDVRERTGLSRTTIWRLERRGIFPKHRRISPNVVGWLEQEVNAWMLERAQAG